MSASVEGLMEVARQYAHAYFLDTVGVRTPAGVHAGSRVFCICPNGQAYREGGANLEYLVSGRELG